MKIVVGWIKARSAGSTLYDIFDRDAAIASKGFEAASRQQAHPACLAGHRAWRIALVLGSSAVGRDVLRHMSSPFAAAGLSLSGQYKMAGNKDESVCADFQFSQPSR